MELKISKEVKDFIYKYIVEEHGYEYDKITDDDLFTRLCDRCIYEEEFDDYGWAMSLYRKVSKIRDKFFEWYMTTNAYESNFDYKKEIVEVEPYDKTVIDYKIKVNGRD